MGKELFRKTENRICRYYLYKSNIYIFKRKAEILGQQIEILDSL